MTPSWRERLDRLPLGWLAALVAAFAFLAYAGAIPSGFVFDDDHAILSNPVIQGEVPLWHAFLRDFWGRAPGAPDAAGTYRPLPVLLLALEWKLSGGTAWVMHLGNVLWHAATVACFLLAFTPLIGRGRALATAVLATVLCAPSEAVQALVGRADLMSACFLLLALLFHRREGGRATLLAAACFGMALDSKESALMALPAFWVLDRLFRTQGASRMGRFAAYGVVTASYLMIRTVALGSALHRTMDPQSNPLLQASALERLLGAGRVFLERYVAGLVDPGRRLYECSAWACGPAKADDVLAWAGLLLAVAVFLSPLLLWKRSREAAAGMAWFVLFFLPVSNFLVLSPSLYGERLLYVPLFGLGVALLTGVEALARRLARPALAWGIVVALGLANLAALQVRHLDWRDEHALFPSALELADNSAKVQQNLAVIFFKDQDWEAAEAHARRALELWPDNERSRPLLALSLDQLGRTQEAEQVFLQGLSESKAGALVCAYASFLNRHQRFPEALAVLRANAAVVAKRPPCQGLRQKLEATVSEPPPSPR